MGKKGCLWVVLRMKTSDQSERNSRPGRLSPRGKRAPPPADKYYQVVQEGDTTEAHNAAQLKVSPQAGGRKRSCSSGHGSGRSCWKVLLAPAGHQACAPSGKLSPEPGLVFRSPTTSRTTSTRGRRPGEDLAWCKLGIPCQLSPTALTCREIVEILS